MVYTFKDNKLADIAQEVSDLLRDDLGFKRSSDIQLLLQKIVYGAPGTGKSHCTDDEAKKYASEEEIVRTTFHPESDYSTFVGCYKPTMGTPDNKLLSVSELINKLTEIKKAGITYPCHKFAAQYWKSLKQITPQEKSQIISECGFSESMARELDKGVAIGEDFAQKNSGATISYSFVPQAFTKAYVKAWLKVAKGEPQFLIIEEINRGNCAQIFGDLFQLLDRAENGESRYSIDPDKDLQKYLAQEFANVEGIPDEIRSGEKLKLPPNLYIWATMNTSDQSLFPMDSAFKRRWDWEYVPITDAGEGYTIKTASKTYDWYAFLEAMNEKILAATESEDKQMGYFFAKPRSGKEISADVFVNKVFFYLWNSIFKDCYTEQEFLKKDDTSYLTFTAFFKDKDACINLLMANLGVEGKALPKNGDYNTSTEDDDVSIV